MNNIFEKLIIYCIIQLKANCLLGKFPDAVNTIFFANHVTIKLSQYKTMQRRHWLVSHKLKLNQYYVSRTTPNSSWEKCWVHEGPKYYTTYLWYSSDWVFGKKMFISLQNEKLN